jgi:3-oxoacyl-[acyl-carrier protein] reductase
VANILAGTVAVVAGGARGIGRAAALRLAELGARVAVLDVNLDAGAEFGEELSAPTVQDELIQRAGDGLAIQVDLTDAAATEAAFQHVHERWSRLDSLVIPAGGAITPFADSSASTTSDEDFSRLVAVNMQTVLNSCRAGVPRMRASGGGAIVTVASGSALTVAPGGYIAVYAMTKAAVAQYTRYLAVEVGPWGIRVNCIAPGVVRTARVIAQSAASGFVVDEAALKQIPLQRQGEPADIADAVQYFVTPISAFVTGQLLAVDGGATLR